MMNLIAIGAVALGLAQQTDTTLTVRANGAVTVENFGGMVTVRTWDRPTQLRVRATHSSRNTVDINASGGRVQIEVGGRYGPGQADLELTVPKAYGVAVEGVNTRIDVEGVDGDIQVETVNGAVRVVGGRGRISAESVQGGVTIENASGRIHASSMNMGVHIRNSSGDIQAEAVNGPVLMYAVDSRNVSAETVNGSIEYDGPVHDDGKYTLATHNGRILMTMPERANARVSVYTFNGRLSTSFPAELDSERTRGRYNFTVGTGGATIELESFGGAIQLVRPGEIKPRTLPEPRKGKSREFELEHDHLDAPERGR